MGGSLAKPPPQPLWELPSPEAPSTPDKQGALSRGGRNPGEAALEKLQKSEQSASRRSSHSEKKMLSAAAGETYSQTVGMPVGHRPMDGINISKPERSLWSGYNLLPISPGRPAKEASGTV